MKEIYLAGGCFWGTEHFFKQIEGVTETEVGFANGHTDSPTYQEVYTDTTGYAETVRIRYDEHVAHLEFLLNMFFKAIDPTSINRQGHDEGTRYRTGIYYTSEDDLPVIRKVMAEQQAQLAEPIAVEVEPLHNFYPADESHQDYLDKHPDGYCHLPLELFAFARKARPLLLLLLLCTFLLPGPARASWHIQAESPKTRILLRGDTLDITSPQGLSLWWDQPLTAPCTIEYRACVVMNNGPCDRLSDLNCFWMASLPATSHESTPSSPLAGKFSGSFIEYYRLQCYYLGYGGNYNTTSRFRRYNGDTTGNLPAILKEYTDANHLLRPNHWYDVRIEVLDDGRTRYYLDNELLVDYLDPAPLRQGWFAFRTTWSHIRLTAFRTKNQPVN